MHISIDATESRVRHWNAQSQSHRWPRQPGCSKLDSGPLQGHYVFFYTDTLLQSWNKQFISLPLFFSLGLMSYVNFFSRSQVLLLMFCFVSFLFFKSTELSIQSLLQPVLWGEFVQQHNPNFMRLMDQTVNEPFLCIAEQSLRRACLTDRKRQPLICG